MCIRDGSAKTISVIGGYAVVLLSGFLIGIVCGPTWGVVATSGLVLALVWTLTRWFRGENESDEPRSWWRMTARPIAGYVLAGWFLLQAIGTAVAHAPAVAPAAAFGVVVAVIAAVAYTNSSVRLSRQDDSLAPEDRFQ
jgi:hypothetical protein